MSQHGTPILFLKAIIRGGAAGDLFGTTVEVAGHTRDGKYVAPYSATRQKAAPKPPAPKPPAKAEWEGRPVAYGHLATIEHEGVSYKASLHKRPTGHRWHLSTAGEKSGPIGHNMYHSGTRTLGSAVDYLRGLIKHGELTVHPDGPPGATPAAVAAPAKAKAAPDPADLAELRPQPAHLVEMRAKLATLKKQRYPGASGEFLTKLYGARLAADPSRWKVGMGVRYPVAGGGKGAQWNRGFRIVDVSPDDKMALLRMVRDTGLTTSGGNDDRIDDVWVYMGELVRERSGDSPAPAPASNPAVRRTPSHVADEGLAIAPEIPSQVIDYVKRALASLADVRATMDRHRSESDVRTGHQGEAGLYYHHGDEAQRHIAAAHASLAKVRNMAEAKGIDFDAVLASLGGVTDTTPLQPPAGWVDAENHYQRRDLPSSN